MKNLTYKRSTPKGERIIFWKLEQVCVWHTHGHNTLCDKYSVVPIDLIQKETTQ